MTVRDELQELTKWISELEAKGKKPKEDPKPATRKTWQTIAGDLHRAAEQFEKAWGGLEAQEQTTLAEFARDMEREVESLARRARTLGRRAPSDPEPEATETEGKGSSKDKDATEPREDPPKPLKAPPRPAKDLILSAQGTIQTAYNRFDAVPEPGAVPAPGAVAEPDAVAKDFMNDLDVLSEMTLSLLQECDRLPDPAPETEPLPRRSWRTVGSDLDRAAEHFGKTWAALEAQEETVLADRARDLENHAGRLAVSAHERGRKTPPGPKPTSGDEQREPGRERKPKTEAPPNEAEDLIVSVQGTIRTAYKRFDAVAELDSAARDFMEELEALHANTLRLLRECGPVPDAGKAS